MGAFKQSIKCTACGHNTVTVITKQTKYSRSVKIRRCTKCKYQPGVFSTLKIN